MSERIYKIIVIIQFENKLKLNIANITKDITPTKIPVGECANLHVVFYL